MQSQTKDEIFTVLEKIIKYYYKKKWKQLQMIHTFF